MDKRYRILIVDDEFVNTQLIKSALRDEYDILTAQNGYEGIDLTKRCNPDLILLDVMMPDLSGFEVCKTIRADARFDSTPIIFLTALDTLEGQLQGLGLGGIDYLSKPVDLVLLKLRVRNHLVMKEQRDQLTRQKAELEDALAKLAVQNERQREADEMLRESEARFRNLLQNIPSVAVQGYALDGTTQYWNKGSELLYGYTEQEAIGRSLLDLIIPPEMKEDVTHAVRQMSETGEAIPASELTLMRKDGSRVPVFSSHAVILGSGRDMELFCLDIDITPRKQAEEERRILEQQFQQAQKLESLGVLAGGIAHDFNNILAIIIGYCGLTKIDYGKAKNNISHIEMAAERAASLCRQMLAYAGKSQPVVSQVNMSVLVDEMVTMLKATTNQNVAIVPHLSVNLPILMGDASQLRQIVMNLIINAAEAIGDAQGVIKISLTKTVVTVGQREKDHLGTLIPVGCYICLEISDTGCGMDEETKQRLFEPFYSTKFSGRGLGMSATLGIITAHKGALQLSSRQGHGSTFKIYLPVQNSDAADQETLRHEVHAPWQGSGTILLVEDEEQVMCVARAMLEALGFTVVEASNGKEALEMYRKNAADIMLVVTDIGMPVMDGYALFRELKAVNPLLPIIISSGYGDAEVSSRIAHADIAGLFSKPYNFEKMREVLQSIVAPIKYST